MNDASTVTGGASPSSETGSRSIGPGEIIGDRYEIRERVGAGGMGEVWRAFDLRLRVEVALKLVRPGRGGAALHREVLAARQVVSVNVCRVFDLLVIDGRELVSMELIDGSTLLDYLRTPGLGSLAAASRVAGQLLAGLEAIHRAGLVHRDVKPENIMITRAGRVVLTDFGLAGTPTVGAGGSGTEPYRAPEQIEGEPGGPPADVFAAGVVLAEMAAFAHTREAREQVWSGARQVPPKVPDGPWAPVLRRALARDPADRWRSARDLARAIEEVALGSTQADAEPYPGLGSHDNAAAKYFFGREAEAEALWRRLRRPRLLAVVGPSGVGKTSFLRAGVMPARPEGWGAVRCTPGHDPEAALRGALSAALAGCDQVYGDDLIELARRVRLVQDGLLVVVDQAEELFTQCTAAQQKAFATLLSRLPLEADTHVLLAMRDDFLFHCHELPPLAPIFTDLMPLGPPRGADLRRALVQPALLAGYRFEDEALVDEMLAEVEGERGALPLLAFAMWRLWQERDPQRGVLERDAYHTIGGVAGALAQHAEQVFERLGSRRRDLVRELFRALVSAAGTRVAVAVDELLERCGDERDAGAVLNVLIEARLLTVYELSEGDRSTRRVELIHESLLNAWPRLLRWRSQDVASTHLAEHLRQAARIWKQRGRPSELLWRGAAWHELEAWLERPAVAMVKVEREFAAACEQLAARRIRRRRMAVFATLASLLLVIAVMVVQNLRVVEQKEHAEASNLFALAQLANERSRALAYAIASLERADNPVVRLLALRSLWDGPTALALSQEDFTAVTQSFSADGRLMVLGGADGRVQLWSDTGELVLELKAQEGRLNVARLSPSAEHLLTSARGDRWVHLWSLPDGGLLHRFNGGSDFSVNVQPNASWTRILNGAVSDGLTTTEWGWWDLANGKMHQIGTTPSTGLGDTDPRVGVATSQGDRILMRRFDDFERPFELGRHDAPVMTMSFSPDGSQLAALDTIGALRLWPVPGSTTLPRLVGTAPEIPPASRIEFDHAGSRLTVGSFIMQPRIWDLETVPGAEPLVLDEALRTLVTTFHPDPRWSATIEVNPFSGVRLWAHSMPYPQVLRGHEGWIYGIELSPDGRWLASASSDGSLRLWPLSSAVADSSRVLYANPHARRDLYRLGWSADGQAVWCGTRNGSVVRVSLDGEVQELTGLGDTAWTTAVDPDGRFVAAGGWGTSPETTTIHVWDLATGAHHVLDDGNRRQTHLLEFLPGGRLLARDSDQTRVWDLPSRSCVVLPEAVLALDRERRYAVIHSDSRGYRVRDLSTGESSPLPKLAELQPRCLAIGPEARIVVVAEDSGAIYVLPTAGGHSQVLLGHEGPIFALDVSADGNTIVSSGWDDTTIRIWQLPDFSQPSPLDLAHEDFVTGLRSFTNLRVHPDPTDPSGYSLALDPFPGWSAPPGWTQRND